MVPLMPNKITVGHLLPERIDFALPTDELGLQFGKEFLVPSSPWAIRCIVAAALNSILDAVSKRAEGVKYSLIKGVSSSLLMFWDNMVKSLISNETSARRELCSIASKLVLSHPVDLCDSRCLTPELQSSVCWQDLLGHTTLFATSGTKG